MTRNGNSLPKFAVMHNTLAMWWVSSRLEDKPMRRREFLTILGSAALISPATGGAVDAFPNRPTRLIIPHQ